MDTEAEEEELKDKEADTPKPISPGKVKRFPTPARQSRITYRMAPGALNRDNRDADADISKERQGEGGQANEYDKKVAYARKYYNTSNPPYRSS